MKGLIFCLTVLCASVFARDTYEEHCLFHVKVQSVSKLAKTGEMAAANRYVAIVSVENSFTLGGDSYESCDYSIGNIVGLEISVAEMANLKEDGLAKVEYRLVSDKINQSESVFYEFRFE